MTDRPDYLDTIDKLRLENEDALDRIRQFAPKWQEAWQQAKEEHVTRPFYRAKQIVGSKAMADYRDDRARYFATATLLLAFYHYVEKEGLQPALQHTRELFEACYKVHTRYSQDSTLRNLD